MDKTATPPSSKQGWLFFSFFFLPFFCEEHNQLRIAQHPFCVPYEKQTEGNSYILEEAIVGYSHLIIQRKKHFSEQGQKCNFTAVMGPLGFWCSKQRGISYC